MKLDWDNIHDNEYTEEESCINNIIALSNQEKLAQQSEQLINQIVDVDASKTKDFIGLFNANEAKRNMMRMAKLNTLYDKVTDQMLARFERTPDNFSNDDLIKFMRTTQDAVKQTSEMVNRVKDEPAIQVQNNQVNINVTQQPELSKESKERVAEAVKSILAKLSASAPIEVIDAEVIEVEDE